MPASNTVADNTQGQRLRGSAATGGAGVLTKGTPRFDPDGALAVSMFAGISGLVGRRRTAGVPADRASGGSVFSPEARREVENAIFGSMIVRACGEAVASCS